MKETSFSYCQGRSRLRLSFIAHSWVEHGQNLLYFVDGPVEITRHEDEETRVHTTIAALVGVRCGPNGTPPRVAIATRPEELTQLFLTKDSPPPRGRGENKNRSAGACPPVPGFW